VARALIVGCGCRGRDLGGRLLDRDWRVRGTSRGAEGRAAIEAAGIEADEADPERPGTILDLCGDVTVVVWLLGSALGGPEVLAAIHGPRLERLLERLVDSPVRGFAYEAAGSVEERYLDGGRAIVERAGETWRIPVAALEEKREVVGWAERTAIAVTRLARA
jgi:nucleoside-diphosphate-sugar epimerase